MRSCRLSFERLVLRRDRRASETSPRQKREHAPSLVTFQPVEPFAQRGIIIVAQAQFYPPHARVHDSEFRDAGRKSPHSAQSSLPSGRLLKFICASHDAGSGQTGGPLNSSAPTASIMAGGKLSNVAVSVCWISKRTLKALNASRAFSPLAAALPRPTAVRRAGLPDSNSRRIPMPSVPETLRGW